VVRIIDQRKLPHRFEIEDLRTWEEMAVQFPPLLHTSLGWTGSASTVRRESSLLTTYWSEST